jgi:hypothetical protein
MAFAEVKFCQLAQATANFLSSSHAPTISTAVTTNLTEPI